MMTFIILLVILVSPFTSGWRKLNVEIRLKERVTEGEEHVGTRTWPEGPSLSIDDGVAEREYLNV